MTRDELDLWVMHHDSLFPGFASKFEKAAEKNPRVVTSTASLFQNATAEDMSRATRNLYDSDFKPVSAGDHIRAIAKIVGANPGGDRSFPYCSLCRRSGYIKVAIEWPKILDTNMGLTLNPEARFRDMYGDVPRAAAFRTSVLCDCELGRHLQDRNPKAWKFERDWMTPADDFEQRRLAEIYTTAPSADAGAMGLHPVVILGDVAVVRQDGKPPEFGGLRDAIREVVGRATR